MLINIDFASHFASALSFYCFVSVWLILYQESKTLCQTFYKTFHKTYFALTGILQTLHYFSVYTSVFKVILS